MATTPVGPVRGEEATVVTTPVDNGTRQSCSACRPWGCGPARWPTCAWTTSTGAAAPCRYAPERTVEAPCCRCLASPRRVSCCTSVRVLLPHRAFTPAHTRTAVQTTFRRIRRRLDWTGHGRTRQPRIHDLRHNSGIRIIPSRLRKVGGARVGCGVRLGIITGCSRRSGPRRPGGIDSTRFARGWSWPSPFPSV